MFLNENGRIAIKISLQFVLKGLIHNKSALLQVMAWRRTHHKPFITWTNADNNTISLTRYPSKTVSHYNNIRCGQRLQSSSKPFVHLMFFFVMTKYISNWYKARHMISIEATPMVKTNHQECRHSMNIVCCEARVRVNIHQILGASFSLKVERINMNYDWDTCNFQNFYDVPSLTDYHDMNYRYVEL